MFSPVRHACASQASPFFFIFFCGLRAYVCCNLEAHAFLTPVCCDMESVRVLLTTASAGPVTPARDGRGRVACGKPAYGRLVCTTCTPILNATRTQFQADIWHYCPHRSALCSFTMYKEGVRHSGSMVSAW